MALGRGVNYGIVIRLDDQGAIQRVEKLDRSLSNLDKSGQTASGGIKRFASSLASLGGVIAGSGIALLGKAVIDTGAKFDSLIRAMQNVTGSVQATNREFGFAADIAEKYGLRLDTTVKSLIQFEASAKGSGVALKDVKRVFEATVGTMAAMGQGTEEISGALTALSQLMSKGVVSAEELRGQLGERMFGAFTQAAEAMGVTTQELGKMLAQGKLLASDFLPKFADQLEKNLGDQTFNSYTQNVARLSNAWEGFKLALADSGSMDLALESVQELTVGLYSVTKAVSVINASWDAFRASIVGALAKAMDAFLGWKEGVLSVFRDILSFASNFDPTGTLTEKVLSLNKSLSAVQTERAANTGALAQAERDHAEAITRVVDALEKEPPTIKEIIQKSIENKNLQDKVNQTLAEQAKRQTDVADAAKQAAAEQSRLAAEEQARLDAVARAETERVQLVLKQADALSRQLVPANKQYLDDINKTVDALLKGNVTTDAAIEKMGKLGKQITISSKAYTESAKEAEAWRQKIDGIFKSLNYSIERTFQGTFRRVLDDGYKGFKGFFKSILSSFKDMIAQLAAANLSKALFGSGGIGGILSNLVGTGSGTGGGAGGGGLLGSLFGGGGATAGGGLIGALLGKSGGAAVQGSKIATSFDGTAIKEILSTASEKGIVEGVKLGAEKAGNYVNKLVSGVGAGAVNLASGAAGLGAGYYISKLLGNVNPGLGNIAGTVGGIAASGAVTGAAAAAGVGGAAVAGTTAGAAGAAAGGSALSGAVAGAGAALGAIPVAGWIALGLLAAYSGGAFNKQNLKTAGADFIADLGASFGDALGIKDSTSKIINRFTLPLETLIQRLVLGDPKSPKFRIRFRPELTKTDTNLVPDQKTRLFTTGVGSTEERGGFARAKLGFVEAFFQGGSKLKLYRKQNAEYARNIADAMSLVVDNVSALVDKQKFLNALKEEELNVSTKGKKKFKPEKAVAEFVQRLAKITGSIDPEIGQRFSQTFETFRRELGKGAGNIVKAAIAAAGKIGYEAARKLAKQAVDSFSFASDTRSKISPQERERLIQEAVDKHNQDIIQRTDAAFKAGKLGSAIDLMLTKFAELRKSGLSVTEAIQGVADDWHTIANVLSYTDKFIGTKTGVERLIQLLSDRELGRVIDGLQKRVNDLSELYQQQTEAVNQLSAAGRRTSLASVLADVLPKQKSLVDLYLEGASRVQDLARSFDGSLDSIREMTQATNEFADIQRRAAQAIIGARRMLNEGIDQFTQSLKFSTLTQEEQYSELKKRAFELKNSLATITDPEEIQRVLQQLQSIGQQAFGLLDPQAQRQNVDEFIRFFEAAQQIGNARLDEIQARAIEITNETNANITDSMAVATDNLSATADQLAVSASMLQDAAAAIQYAASQLGAPNVSINVQPSEVG